jgi:hypothetical protein
LPLYSNRFCGLAPCRRLPESVRSTDTSVNPFHTTKLYSLAAVREGDVGRDQVVAAERPHPLQALVDRPRRGTCWESMMSMRACRSKIDCVGSSNVCWLTPLSTPPPQHTHIALPWARGGGDGPHPLHHLAHLSPQDGGAGQGGGCRQCGHVESESEYDSIRTSHIHEDIKTLTNGLTGMIRSV